jgi:hypothetical protein
LTGFTLLEDRLTALLARIDAATDALTERAARELSSASTGSSAASGGSSASVELEQLRQLTELLERQAGTTRESEAAQSQWLAPLQEQLQRIEQQVEQLHNPTASPATFS